MGFAVVSDIHSNLAAFEAVLDDIKSQSRKTKIDQIFCLGDIVGYGCQPIEVLGLAKKYIGSRNIVVGNHEDICWGNLREEIDDKAMLMAKYNLHLIENNMESTAFLNSLNHKQHYVKATIYKKLRLFLTHNGPNQNYLTYRYPWETDVLLPGLQDEFNESALQPGGIKARFTKSSIDLLFFGHTHFPTVAFKQSDGAYTSVKLNGEFAFEDVPGQYKKILINPGSVGYSRDNNPAASYIIVDDKNQMLIHRRIEYRFDNNGYDQAADWLANNYVDRDKLGGNKIRELVYQVCAIAEGGAFAPNPQELAYDGWREYYNL